MKLSDFSKYRNLTAADKEANWAAIDDLMPHLEDHS